MTRFLSRFVASLLALASSLIFACAAESAPAKTARELLAQAVAAAKQGQAQAAFALAEQAEKLEPNNPDVHYALGRIHEERREFTNALVRYSRVIALDPKAPEAWQFRGTTHFKMGKAAESVADFDQYLERVPSQRAQHWQRGIALYYAGKFDEGRKQFELHQVVNAHDVENAAWHFLCNARARGLKQAREELIPIDGDSRVPMREIFELFAGKGTEAAVLKAADAGQDKARSAEHQNNLFYAHLYLGIFAEAQGDAKLARAHIEKAAGEFAQPHYMGDVAKVHLQLMKEQEAKSKK